MADATVNTFATLIATRSSRVRQLPIQNGQLVFIQDVGRIAFDYNDTRVFYNQITELQTEAERLTLDNPLTGYYFVIDTAILWRYENGWIQITEKPESIVSIDVELPALGQAKENMLYVNKAEREIAIFDKASNEYIIVSDYTNEVSDEDIEKLFM